MNQGAPQCHGRSIELRADNSCRRCHCFSLGMSLGKLERHVLESHASQVWTIWNLDGNHAMKREWAYTFPLTYYLPWNGSTGVLLDSQGSAYINAPSGLFQIWNRGESLSPLSPYTPYTFELWLGSMELQNVILCPGWGQSWGGMEYVSPPPHGGCT